MFITFFKDFYFFTLEEEREGEQAEGQRERIQTDSSLNAEPNTGLDLLTRDHDLSRNQALVA